MFINFWQKVVQYGVQKAPKSKPGGCLGASWAAVGSKAPLRRLLDASRAALGRILGPSWEILGRKNRQHGSNLGAKMEPKWSKNRSNFDVFPYNFWLFPVCLFHQTPFLIKNDVFYNVKMQIFDNFFAIRKKISKKPP